MIFFADAEPSEKVKKMDERDTGQVVEDKFSQWLDAMSARIDNVIAYLNQRTADKKPEIPTTVISLIFDRCIEPYGLWKKEPVPLPRKPAPKPETPAVPAIGDGKIAEILAMVKKKSAGKILSDYLRELGKPLDRLTEQEAATLTDRIGKYEKPPVPEKQ